MLALFQCCANPFFAVSKETDGLRYGPGFRQPKPTILRLRCPHCSQRAEARLASPCVLAHTSPTIQAGTRLLREPHGARLSPIQLTSGRRGEVPTEGGFPLSRAWDLVTALSAASSASHLSRPGDLSPELSAAVIAYHHPDLQAQVRAAAFHCSVANGSLHSPTCRWEIVRMAWKHAPNPSDGSHAHVWHGLSRHPRPH